MTESTLQSSAEVSVSSGQDSRPGLRNNGFESFTDIFFDKVGGGRSSRRVPSPVKKSTAIQAGKASTKDEK